MRMAHAGTAADTTGTWGRATASRTATLISGYAGSLPVSPGTGDLVVVLASNDGLRTWQFLHETVAVWAAEGGGEPA